jgi:hypothetical protein
MNPKQALPGLRIAIGGGAFLAPYLTAKIFGLDATDNNEAVFLARLFGIRDVALGIGQMSSSGEGGQLWWQLGVICDLGDAWAALLGLRAGLPKRGGIMSAATALAAAGMGIAAMNSSPDSGAAA